MAINQNHLFEELNGVKCAIADKNVTKERADFLKQLLEYNGYTVVIAASPPPKAVPTAVPKPVPVSQAINEAQAATPPQVPLPAPSPVPPETFTIGVTDVTFNPTNAIFGRLLQAPGGHVVTLAYWQQKESESRDDVPYFERR